MIALDRRSAALWAGLFLATLVLGGWPRPDLRAAFSRGYAAAADLVLDQLSFGQGGRATLVPEKGEARTGAAVEQDARLVLSVSGYEGEVPFGLSLRRDAFLPCLIVIAALIGAPLPARRKLLCLGAGTAAVLALSLACVYLTAAWLFSGQLTRVYQPSAAWAWVLDVMAGALLLPPSNRFALPLVLAAVLVFVLRGPSVPRARSPRPQPAPAQSGSPLREEGETLPASESR
jgi:hypothetical protein